MTAATLEAATAYRRRNWYPLPIPSGSKAPIVKGWSTLQLGLDELPRHFGAGGNVGLLLGPSGLVDIDLDCEEAVQLAPHLLPPTPTRWGRESRPGSHWLYRCPGAPHKALAIGKDTLVELRAERHQTIVPPSVHPSGERVRWEPDADPSADPAAAEAWVLRGAAHRIAAGVLLMRNGWTLDEALAAVKAPEPPTERELPRDKAGTLIREWCGWLAPASPVAPRRPMAAEAKAELVEATAAYVAANTPGNWPRSGGTCPACRHNDCFGAMPDNPQKWVCWSTGHPDECGTLGNSGQHYGDILDLDAFAAGMKPAEYLRARGYLADRPRSERRATAADDEARVDDDEADANARKIAAATEQIRDIAKAGQDALDEDDRAAATARLDAALASVEVLEGLALAHEANELETAALLNSLRLVKGWTGRAEELGRRIRAEVKRRKKAAQEARRAEQAEPPPGAHPATWVKLHMTGDPPAPVRSRENVRIVLTSDPEYAGRIAYCEFTGRVLLDRREVKDTDETRIATDLGARYGLHYEPAAIGGMMALVAEDNRVHPVREYHGRLKWDGVRRLDTLLPVWLGALDKPNEANPPIVAKMIEKTLIAAVARIDKPGAKVDTVLVLAGPQGVGKSSAFRALAGDEWFSDAAIQITSKDARQALQGVLIWEWAELDSVRGRDMTAVKSFITEQIDRYRPPYGRNVITWPRQCILVGTTNESGFLRDSTGSRRFWVVPVAGKVDVEAIREHRDQLWAEAVELYRRGAQWWLTPEEEADRADIAADYEAEDPWAVPVLRYADDYAPTTTREILEHGLELKARDQNKAAEMRVSAILTAAGWVSKRRLANGARLRVWVRPKNGGA